MGTPVYGHYIGYPTYLSCATGNFSLPEVYLSVLVILARLGADKGAVGYCLSPVENTERRTIRAYWAILRPEALIIFTEGK